MRAATAAICLAASGVSSAAKTIRAAIAAAPPANMRLVMSELYLDARGVSNQIV